MNRFINRVLLFVIGAAALIGCTYNEMTDSYGELDILFDTEDVEPSVVYEKGGN